MLTVSIITPERTLPSLEAVHVTITAVDGQVGVRPGHAPLVAELCTGIALIRPATGKETFLAIRGGIAQVLNNQVRLFVEAVVDVDGVDSIAVQKRIDKLTATIPADAAAAARQSAELQWLNLQLTLGLRKAS